MLREFWFPILLALASIIPGMKGANSAENARRLWWTVTAFMLFLAFAAYLWGDSVRGPFAGLIHSKAPDRFHFHAGVTAEYPVKELSRGIDFSRIISMPNQPIRIRVSRTWWSGWAYEIELVTGAGPSIQIGSKNRHITGLPSGWDYNSDDTSVEIVDDGLNPVFQMIQASDYDIYVNAVIADNRGLFTMMNGSELLVGWPREEALNRFPPRLFRYPSYMNRGRRL